MAGTRAVRTLDEIMSPGKSRVRARINPVKPAIGRYVNRQLDGLTTGNWTQAMFRRRAAAYRQMGYRFEIDEALGRASLRRQLGLFDEAGTADRSGA